MSLYAVPGGEHVTIGGAIRAMFLVKTLILTIVLLEILLFQ